MHYGITVAPLWRHSALEIWRLETATDYSYKRVMGEKGDQEWVKMWGADVKVVNPGNLMPDDMLKSCITTTSYM